MINTKADLSEISWEPEDPGEVLLDSIRRRGVAIPVHVNRTEHGYVCVDGRKRLTACRILSAEDPSFQKVEVMLMNDYSKAGSAYWGNTLNHH
ncbi:MAG: ParB N-terminal domain-containing protein [Bulleidia sp.]